MVTSSRPVRFLAIALCLALVLLAPATAPAADKAKSPKPPAHAEQHAPKPKKAKKHCDDFRHPCAPAVSATTPTTTFATSPVRTFAKWGFLWNGLGTQNAPLVLTVENGSRAPGTAVTLQSLGTNPRGQLWKSAPTGDGESATLWSALGSQTVLSLDLNQPKPYPAVSDPSQIPADSVVTNASLFQRWSYDPSSQSIANQATGGQLYASAAGAGVVLSNASGPGSQWSMSPSYPLAAVMSAAPVPFPAGTTGQAAAYAYINQQLGLGASTCTLGTQPSTGIRCQYPNLAADLSDYKSSLDFLHYPGGASFTLNDFNAVRNQLNLEITAADNVRNLFANAASFIGDVFLDDGETLDKLALDAMLQPASPVYAPAAITFAEGAVYTALSLVPEFGAVANLMEMVVNTALALPGGESLTTTYTGVVSGLYESLAVGFELILSTLGQQELAILTDWGKLQAVSSLITSTGPSSLAWPPTSAGLLRYAVQGYTIVAMQTLLPVNYSITRTVGQTSNTLPGGSSSAFYAEQYGVQSNGDPLWNLYEIADSNGNAPSQAALDDVFDSGVNPHDFFTRANGWSAFSSSDTTPEEIAGIQPTPCNIGLVELTNWTERSDVSLSVVPTDGVLGGNNRNLATSGSGGSGTQSSVEVDLSSYGSALIAGAYDDDGLTFDVTIADSCSTLLSFTLHQHDCWILESDDTWIDTIASGAGCDGVTYPYTTALTTQNGGSNSGAIAVDLYRPLPLIPPTVSGVSPDTVPGNTAGVALTVYGSGFLPGASCTFGSPNIFVAGCEVVSSTQIEATLTIEVNVEGAQSVTITNTDGGFATATDAFTVTAEPWLSDASPPSAEPGPDSIETVSIYGGNFADGATCGIEGLAATPCNFVSASELGITVSIPFGTPAGPRTITVTNPDGTSVAASNLWYVGTAPVSIGSISPSSANPGDFLYVIIEGQYFDQPAVDFGPGINTCFVNHWTQTSIECVINVAADAPAGPQNVTVTNYAIGGSATASGAFSVVYPPPPVPPVIDSVSHDQICHGITKNVSLYGTGFQAGATCSVPQPVMDGVTPCTVVDSQIIDIAITAAGNAPDGPFPLIVTNPDGGSATTTLISVDDSSCL